jgi:hypothetical protein
LFGLGAVGIVRSFSSQLTSHFSSQRFNPAAVVRWVESLGGLFVIAVFVILNGGLMVAGGGKILNFFYPATALIVGLILYPRRDTLYLGFIWWIMFLSPFVRRLSDWKSVWTDPSPILLAPSLVIFVSLLTMVRVLPRMKPRETLPFLVCLVPVCYAFLIGILKNPPIEVLVATLNWFSPLILGFHIFAQYRQYPAYQHSIKRIFVWGSLVMGGYGILQYVVAPPWDCSWMINTEINTNGIPQPFGIRVYSTLNSPQPFACAIKAGLLILLEQIGPISLLASGVGYLSFLLSSARSAWVSWAMSLITYFTLLKASAQVKLVAWVTFAATLVMPLLISEPFATVIQDRLKSFQDIKGDTSYDDRINTFNSAFDASIFEFVGNGIGKDAFAGDHGILSMLYSLGWVGMLTYMAGLFLAFYKLLRCQGKWKSTSMALFTSIALGTVQQIISNMAIIGVLGCIMWAFIGIALAGDRYHEWKARELSTLE